MTNLLCAGILLGSFLVFYLALPKGTERMWVLLSAITAGGSLGMLVLLGDAGTVTKYLHEYYSITSSCMIASGAGLFTALYLACYHGSRNAGAVFLLGLYFAGNVAANALYRRTEYVYDFQRMLQGAVHLWHALVMCGIAIWGMRRTR